MPVTPSDNNARIDDAARLGSQARVDGDERVWTGNRRKSGKEIRDMMKARRRFEVKTKIRPPLVAKFNEARTMFPVTVFEADPLPLKPGQFSKKIGSHVTKGRWKGFPIYYLTLEERATCPRSCLQWKTCYGNRMPFAKRHRVNETLERRLDYQLGILSSRHPRGFVVRLHVLGDFPSIEWFRRWTVWLKKFPNLRIFGYTARDWEELHTFARANWDRFAVRSSGSKALYGAVVDEDDGADDDDDDDDVDAITCPAQLGKTDCCGTCALCWQTTRPIRFIQH